jgi:hypothetical protein
MQRMEKRFVGRSRDREVAVEQLNYSDPNIRYSVVEEA